MTGDKLDLTKRHRELFNPPKDRPVIVEIPSFHYLMTDGEGGIGTSKSFQDAIGALFGVSYKSKFICKQEMGFDYKVMPLEGLWWADDMNDFINNNRDKWKWTLMIMQPVQVTEEIVLHAKEIVYNSKKLEAVHSLRLEQYNEGSAAQIMHIGPYTEEHDNILRVHDCITEQGGWFDGHKHKHHEIYLSDFRRTAPEKLKTVLRQPYVIEK